MTSYLDYIDSDPYDYYATQLQAGPVHWDEGMRAWLAFGYEESRFVATRQEYFHHPYNELRGAKEVQGGTRGILMLQGEGCSSSPAVTPRPTCSATPSMC